MYLEFYESEMRKEKMKQKPAKSWRKLVSTAGETSTNQQASLLLHRRNRWLQEKKIVLSVLLPITPTKKKSVLTTGGGLPMQSGNPLKHTSPCLRDELNKPCSQPDYVNHFKPTLYHHHGKLNRDKESSSEQWQPEGWHLLQHTDTILLPATSVGLASSNCSSFKSLSFAHSQTRAGT